MKARPIIFQGDMVRAILDGRKTQTRRVVKQQPFDGWLPAFNAVHGWSWYPGGNWTKGREPIGNGDCPYGYPGDLLWVRETFAEHPEYPEFFYAADGSEFLDADGAPFIIAGHCKPSIHMPLSLSRLTLRITGVRVERLQEISEADAIAEGIERSAEFSNPEHTGGA